MSATTPHTDQIDEEEFLRMLQEDDDRYTETQLLLIGENIGKELHCLLWNLFHPMRCNQIADIQGRMIATGEAVSLLAQTSSIDVQKSDLCFPHTLPRKGVRSVVSDLRRKCSPEEIQPTRQLVQALLELRKQYVEHIVQLRTTGDDVNGEIEGDTHTTFDIASALRADNRGENEYENVLDELDTFWVVSHEKTVNHICRIQRRIRVAGDISKFLALCSDSTQATRRYCSTEYMSQRATAGAGTDANKLLNAGNRNTAQKRMQDVLELRSRYFARVQQLIRHPID